MGPLGRLVVYVAQHHPQKLPALLKEINVRTRHNIPDVKALPAAVDKMEKTQPNKYRNIVLGAVAAIIGDVALNQAIDYVEGKATNGVYAPAPVSSGELADLRGNADQLTALVAANAGDHTPLSLWGVPQTEVAEVNKQLMTAFSLINHVAPIFGGVSGMREAFVAFHSLELMHFDLYKQNKKVLG